MQRITLSFSLSRDVRVIGITYLGERYNRMPHLDDVSYRPMFRAISERQTKYGIRVDLARLFFSGEDLLKWCRENDAVNFTKLPRKITFTESDVETLLQWWNARWARDQDTRTQSCFPATCPRHRQLNFHRRTLVNFSSIYLDVDFTSSSRRTRQSNSYRDVYNVDSKLSIRSSKYHHRNDLGEIGTDRRPDLDSFVSSHPLASLTRDQWRTSTFQARDLRWTIHYA